MSVHYRQERGPNYSTMRNGRRVSIATLDWLQLVHLPQHSVMPLTWSTHQRRCLLPQPGPAASTAASNTPLKGWQSSWLQQPESAGTLERVQPRGWP